MPVVESADGVEGGALGQRTWHKWCPHLINRYINYLSTSSTHRPYSYSYPISYGCNNIASWSSLPSYHYSLPYEEALLKHLPEISGPLLLSSRELYRYPQRSRYIPWRYINACRFTCSYGYCVRQLALRPPAHFLSFWSDPCWHCCSKHLFTYLLVSF
jgi:hypothetical protein